MALKHDRYIYHVTWSEEDEEYVGLCAEFPSLSWLDETAEEVLTGIRQIVADVIADMQTTGEKVPDPISRQPTHVPWMVYLPAELPRQFAIQAAEAGISA